MKSKFTKICPSETRKIQNPRNLTPAKYSCHTVSSTDGADDASVGENLFQSHTLAECKYPNCGFVASGDLNRLDIGGRLRLSEMHLPMVKDLY